MSAFVLALAAFAVAPQSAPAAAGPTEIDEVVVTGSLIRGPSRLFAVQSVDRADIQAAGVLDVARLPTLGAANAGSEHQVDQLNDPQSSGTAQFNLRNLGLGSTLILLNGRRQTTSAVVSSDGAAFTDIASITPLIALERIEILKEGASATYGSDAVAGVVNLITRRTVDRPELSVRHAMADGSAETLIEGLAGGELFGGDLVLAASRFHRSSLGTDDRDFTQAERYGRASWSAVTSYGQPGSYFRPSTGAYAPDPDCDNPAFEGAYRNSATDSFCRLDYSDFFDLAPREDRTLTHASWRRRFGPGLTVSADAGWASSETEVRQSPSLPILAGSPVVPAAHPDNPFGEAVLFRGRLLGAEAGASHALFAYDTRRASLAIEGRLAGGWLWTASTAWSRQTVAYDKPDVIGSRLTLALNGLGGAQCAGGAPGVGGCQWYNPFASAHLGTGAANSAELIAWMTGSTGLRGAASLWTADVQTTGDIWSTGDASLTLVVGAQVRDSRFRHDWSDLANAGELLTAGLSPDFSGRQRTTAAFAEARLRWTDRFEAQLALRGERYSDGPAKLNPRLAVVWSVNEALALRVGYAESFKAPSVYATSGAQASQPSVFDRGAYVFVNTVTRGSPDLAPERSKSWTGAVVWTPLSHLKVSLEGWRHETADLVVKEQAQALIDQAAADTQAGLSGTDAQTRVTRDGSGALSLIDLRFRNAAWVDTRGLDLSVDWSREIARGTLAVRADWTHVDRYDVRLTPQSAIISAVGRTNLATLARSLPQDRGNLTASLDGSNRLLSARFAYVSGYVNDRAGVTETKIGSHLTLDLAWTERLSGGWAVSFGIVNATDEPPPLVQYALGYDPIVHDPRGRIVSFGFDRTF